MRFTGKLASWNDDRGYGFIEAVPGGDPVFVHIKAFDGRGGRPVVGQMVSFAVEPGPRGKKRATSVERVVSAPGRRRATQVGRRDGRPMLAIVAFVALYLAVASAWKVPAWVAALYAAMSVVCAIAYLVDKSAAERGHRRVSEQTLLGLGLAGGWPGAIVAQQVLRHKTGKATFQSRFRLSVVVNVLAFAVLASPWSTLPRHLGR